MTFNRSHFIAAVLFTLLSLSTQLLSAQGWERHFGAFYQDIGFDAIPTRDGGFAVTGEQVDINGNFDVFVIKLDPNGLVQWYRNYGGSAIERARSIRQLPDGGYIVLGQTATFSTGDYDLYLLRLTAFGDTLWSRTYGGSLYEQGDAVRQTADGGFILTGTTASFGAGSNDVYLVRVDSLGDTLWTKTYGGTNSEGASSLVICPDGGFAISAATYSFGAGNQDAWLIRTDSNGVLLWDKTQGGAAVDFALDLVLLPDSGFALVGESNPVGGGPRQMLLYRTNSNGDTLWTRRFSGLGYGSGAGLSLDQQGNLGACGYTNVFPNSPTDAWLVKTDLNGALIFENTFGEAGVDGAEAINAVPGGGYILSGETRSYGSGGLDMYIIRTDSLGNSLSNLIQGTVYEDLNLNCQLESFEQGLKDIVIRLDPGPRYATTDASGHYQFRADTGTYTLTQLLPNAFRSQLCPTPPAGHTVRFTQPYDTASGKDFADEVDIWCPLMEVDVSTPILRRCRQAVYTVTYCNKGTLQADSAYIELDFDPYLYVDSAALPWRTPQSGQQYVFDLGRLMPGDCGSFKVWVTVDCDSTITGQSHCVSAHIYPDTICIPPGSNWDGASIAVNAECDGDSLVKFTIANVGNANMAATGGFLILEDNIMRLQGSIRLNAGADTVFTRPATGGTWVIRAYQRPGHPGRSRLPTAALEGCGRNSGGSFSIGYVTAVAQDDADPFVSIDCQINRASYDPNDKRSFAKGIGPQHLIEAEDELEYIIRFQNTGNDTAFTVVIRDTLPGFLDVGHLTQGASSHAYSFRIYQNAILEWTFNDIMLPDSSTDFNGSIGFVKFRIPQVDNNPLGTLIENRAGIYFDFNAPIITNTAFNTIGEEIYGVLTPVVPVVEDERLAFRVYPNPFRDRAWIEVGDAGAFGAGGRAGGGGAGVAGGGETGVAGGDGTGVAGGGGSGVAGGGGSGVAGGGSSFGGTGFSMNRLTSRDLWDMQVEVYDLQGQRVRTIGFAGKRKVEVVAAGLQPGAYLYRIVGPAGVLGTGKMILWQ